MRVVIWLCASRFSRCSSRSRSAAQWCAQIVCGLCRVTRRHFVIGFYGFQTLPCHAEGRFHNGSSRHGKEGSGSLFAMHASTPPWTSMIGQLGGGACCEGTILCGMLGLFFVKHIRDNRGPDRPDLVDLELCHLTKRFRY